MNGDEDGQTNGRTRPGEIKRSWRCIDTYHAKERGIFKFRMGLVGHLSQGLERKSSSM